MARHMPCFGAMMLVLVSGMGYANPVPDFPFVILTERLEKQVAPDVAEITILLEAFALSSAESLEQLRAAGARVTEVLQRSDIPLSALVSTQIDKRAKRASRDRTYNLEILGYETTQGLTLQLTDLGKYPSLMNDLVLIDGLSSLDAVFESTKESELGTQMIQELSVATRAKADTLAAAQGRAVKRVYGITTERNFGEAYAIFALRYTPSVAYAASLAQPRGRDLTMMVPQHIVVSQRMTAIYELK